MVKWIFWVVVFALIITQLPQLDDGKKEEIVNNTKEFIEVNNNLTEKLSELTTEVAYIILDYGLNYTINKSNI